MVGHTFTRPVLEKADEEIRIVLLGKTGSGKSALGNSLLGKKIFASHASAGSTTTVCQTGERTEAGKQLIVTDTPGLFDSGKTKMPKVLNSMGRSSHLHTVFVLVLRIGRLDREGEEVITQLMDIFGKDAMKELMVVFTGKDDLEYDHGTLETFIQESPRCLRELLEKCGSRFTAVNNRAKGDNLRTDMEHVLEIIQLTRNDNTAVNKVKDEFGAVDRKLTSRNERRQRNKRLNKLRKQFQNHLKEILSRDESRAETSELTNERRQNAGRKREKERKPFSSAICVMNLEVNKNIHIISPVVKVVVMTILILNRLSCAAGVTLPDIDAVVGSSVIIDLSPLPSSEELKCYQDQKPMNIDERFKKSELGDTIRLSIENITLDDAGVYSCNIAHHELFIDVRVNVTDVAFKWLLTKKEVTSNYEHDVELEWKFETSKPANTIIFTRPAKNSNRNVEVGVWSKDEGFTMNRAISTDVQLFISPVLGQDQGDGQGQEGLHLILKLLKAYPVDFDLVYTCQIFYGKNVFFAETVELKAIKPRLSATPEVVKGTQGQDVTFVWKYKYTYPLVWLSVSTDEGSMDDLGYWYNDQFEPTDESYKDRLNLDVTRWNGETCQLNLTLLATTETDFNVTYYCSAVGEDGYEAKQGIKLVTDDPKAELAESSQDNIQTNAAWSGTRTSLLHLFIILFSIVRQQD